MKLFTQCDILFKNSESVVYYKPEDQHNKSLQRDNISSIKKLREAEDRKMPAAL